MDEPKEGTWKSVSEPGFDNRQGPIGIYNGDLPRLVEFAGVMAALSSGEIPFPKCIDLEIPGATPEPNP